ncbi:MAG: hypothetical protein OXG70_02405 [Cyanobacteria bacterium MAG IRC1_bin_28]|nr:hypothetical protein [Cyanobacteria bacterium MAG IRC1_bin_28]
MDEETGTTLPPTASLSGRRQWIITDLDLEPILVKAMDAEEGHGWTLGFARRVEEEYRRFLVLCLERGQDTNHLILPSRPVADFWHLHILDTEKYIKDCRHCFGSILHHHFGRRTDQDTANLQEAYGKTVALYGSTSGKKPPADVWGFIPPSDLALAYLDHDDHGAEDVNPSHETPSHTVRNKAGARQWIMEHLDLEPILVKAMDAEKSNGWTLGFARRVAQEYRRFLVLCLEHRQDTNHLVVPSKLVDKFWHLHILDTRKYIEDCQHCFGSVLHHFPYFGMRGDKDAINLRETYYETFVLYRSAFGKQPPADIWPHSKTALEYRSRVRADVVKAWSGEDAEFDRRRPRLLPQVTQERGDEEVYAEVKNLEKTIKDHTRKITDDWEQLGRHWKQINVALKQQNQKRRAILISLVAKWTFSLMKVVCSCAIILLATVFFIIFLILISVAGGSERGGASFCSGGCGGGGCGGCGGG